ncbi:MAG: hypothetical protein ACR2RF_25550 [Geminicoccaceae bacterium]
MAEPALVDPGDAITRARRLAALRSAFADRILDAETAVLQRATTEYWGDILTPQRAFGYIAELATLQRLLSEMEADAKRAEQQGNI